jgi:hypothetical protein
VEKTQQAADVSLVWCDMSHASGTSIRCNLPLG